uniref:Core protein n=1 Tax=Hepatitis B virus TaxID=10407 RepID=A0A8F3CIM0_HBV|nr:MAG: core protein [Hepatitis B virus]
MARIDPYLEFGIDEPTINLLPVDYIMQATTLAALLKTQFEDQLDSAQHYSPHHTALRQLVRCYQHAEEFTTWVLAHAMDQETKDGVRAKIQPEYNRLVRAIWYHWGCLNYGQQTMKDFIISWVTWHNTPAIYRPPNAPILTLVGTAPNYFGRRGRSPAPTRRRSKSKSRSPSPRRK